MHTASVFAKSKPGMSARSRGRPDRPTLSDKLRAFLKETGWTQQQLATRCGKTQPWVNRLVAGKSGKKIPYESLAALARGTGRPISFWRDVSQEIENGIPVVGHVAAGETDIAFDDMGYPTGVGFEYVGRPDWLDDPHAYGLKVKGNSMAPRFRSGDLIVVRTDQPVRQGREAVVRVRSGQTYLKVYWEKHGIVTLESINREQPPLTFPVSEVVFKHRVVLIVPA